VHKALAGAGKAGEQRGESERAHQRESCLARVGRIQRSDGERKDADDHRDPMTNPLLDEIAGLRYASVSPARAEATRARCHRVLARRTPSPKQQRVPLLHAWPRAIITVGALYIAEAIRLALKAYGAR